MLRLISDENFHGDIVRGLHRRLPALDIIRVQDAGLSGIDDPSLLTFAFEQNRILLTHDRTTIPQFVIDRFRAGESAAGIFVVDDRASIGRLIDELALVIQCSGQDEWQNRLLYFPMP